MFIVSLKTGTDGALRRMELSDGSLFSFHICYVPPFIDARYYTPGIEGLEISADEASGFRFASACLRAEKAALRLITRAEQTVFGLSRKLEKRGHDAACIGAVVSRLGEMGLLDDSRYARLWLESRIGRPSSPRRLLAALCARNINRHDAQAALQEVLDDEAEQQLLAHYIRRHFTHIKAADYRAVRYRLKGEGFSSAAIQQYWERDD